MLTRARKEPGSERSGSVARTSATRRTAGETGAWSVSRLCCHISGCAGAMPALAA